MRLSLSASFLITAEGVMKMGACKVKDIYSSYSFARESIDKFLCRMETIRSCFNREEILDEDVYYDIYDILDGSAQALDRKFSSIPDDRREKEEMLELQNNCLETYGVVLLAAINRNTEGQRFGRTSMESKSYLRCETLEVLAQPQVLMRTHMASLKELIYLCVAGLLPEYLAEAYVTHFDRFITKPNNNLYKRIMNNQFVDKIDELSYILFLDHGISFVYYDRYRDLHEEAQEEFWKWIDLKPDCPYLKNPARRFFELYKKSKKAGHGLKPVIRQRVIFQNQARKYGEDLITQQAHHAYDEIAARMAEIEDYDENSFWKSRFSQMPTSKHHLFFPKSQYKHPIESKMFVNNHLNLIVINDAMHKKLTRYFHKKRYYQVPRLTMELIEEIYGVRQVYENGYQDFLSLQVALLQIHLRYQGEVVGQLAYELYEFLRLQAEFITPETAKP